MKTVESQNKEDTKIANYLDYWTITQTNSRLFISNN